MKTYAFDTETVGLHGIAVLLQYGLVGSDDIQIHNFWINEVGRSRDVIDEVCSEGVVGFNCSFDSFVLCKMRTILEELPRSFVPITNPRAVEDVELQARFGKCLRPKAILDLMMHARKGPFQALMNRDPIRIKKVPVQLAEMLVEELEQRVELDRIFFAGFKDANRRPWQIYEIEDEKDFVDIVLMFNPEGGLKALAKHVLGFQDTEEFSSPPIPEQKGWCPWHNWLPVIEEHVRYWETDTNARRYARNDIVYTRALFDHFGRPELGDDDSELTWAVGATRWRGFSINIEHARSIREKAAIKAAECPINLNSTTEIRNWVGEALSPITRALIAESVNKQCLTEVIRLDPEAEAGKRAQRILNAKSALKEVEQLDKIIEAGRWHPDFHVIGAKSGRMSGTGGLNPQAIKGTVEMRSVYTCADEDEDLGMGDFDSFEVALAEAVYDDPDLRKALTSGKKIHGIFGTCLYPGNTYEDILASAHSEVDMYGAAKSGVFSQIYGGSAFTLHTKLEIPMPVAEAAVAQWREMFPQLAATQQAIADLFTAMRQAEAHGAILWSEPAPFVETKLGFRRYFSLENQVQETLFQLASRLPKHFRDVKIKVVRRDRVQTGAGAVSSALYACAFGIQSARIRQATNHQIQSLGASICKTLQRRIWDLQPTGFHPFKVRTANIHDEVLAVCDQETKGSVKPIVDQTIQEFKEMVPFIGMAWKTDCKSWGEK